MSRRRTRVPRGFRRFRPTPSAPQLRPRGAPGTAVLRGGPSQQLHTLRPSRGTWLTCSSLLPVSPSAFALYLLPVRGRNLQPRALLTALSLAPPCLHAVYPHAPCPAGGLAVLPAASGSCRLVYLSMAALPYPDSPVWSCALRYVRTLPMRYPFPRIPACLSFPALRPFGSDSFP